MEQNYFDQQADSVVYGFMQVWNKFEATLSKELSHVQERLNTGAEPQPTSKYELFYRVSSSIQDKESVTMGELSRIMSVPMSTATRIADWLVDKGYFERWPDPKDRRVIRLSLTPAGKEIHKTIDSYVKERIERILSCLTREEQSILLTLMGKVVYGLKDTAN